MILLAWASFKSRVKQRLVSVVILVLALVMMQGQIGMFQGIMDKKYGAMSGMQGVDLCVKPAFEGDGVIRNELLKLQRLEGVESVTPFFRGTGALHLGKRDERCSIIGMDEKFLNGFSRSRLFYGSEKGIYIDRTLWGLKQKKIRVGSILHVENDQAVVLGIVKEKKSREPYIYTTVERAKELSRDHLGETFFLVKAKDGVDLAKLSTRIEKEMGSKALLIRDIEKGLLPGFRSLMSLCLTLTLGIITVVYYFLCNSLKRELSVMKTIGGSFALIFLFVAFQTVVVGSFAWVIYLSIASLLTIFFSISLLWMSLTLGVMLFLALITSFLFTLRIKEVI